MKDKEDKDYDSWKDDSSYYQKELEEYKLREKAKFQLKSEDYKVSDLKEPSLLKAQNDLKERRKYYTYDPEFKGGVYKPIYGDTLEEKEKRYRSFVDSMENVDNSWWKDVTEIETKKETDSGPAFSFDSNDNIRGRYGDQYSYDAEPWWRKDTATKPENEPENEKPDVKSSLDDKFNEWWRKSINSQKEVPPIAHKFMQHPVDKEKDYDYRYEYDGKTKILKPIEDKKEEILKRDVLNLMNLNDKLKKENSEYADGVRKISKVANESMIEVTKLRKANEVLKRKLELLESNPEAYKKRKELDPFDEEIWDETR